MKLREIIQLVEGELLGERADLDLEMSDVCASDLMSDVLAFAEPGSLLLTGLINPQAVRTADMADIAAIVFVRGKYPPVETIALAQGTAIPVVASPLSMFEVCGRLHRGGMSDTSGGTPASGI